MHTSAFSEYTTGEADLLKETASPERVPFSRHAYSTPSISSYHILMTSRSCSTGSQRGHNDDVCVEQ